MFLQCCLESHRHVVEGILLFTLIGLGQVAGGGGTGKTLAGGGGGGGDGILHSHAPSGTCG